MGEQNNENQFHIGFDPYRKDKDGEMGVITVYRKDQDGKMVPVSTKRQRSKVTLKEDEQNKV